MTYNGSDTMAQGLITALEGYQSTYKDLDLRLTAADGDKDKAIKAFIDSSEDAQAVKLRTAIAAAHAKLAELAEKSVVVETLDDETKAKLTAEHAALSTQIRDARKAILSVSSTFNKDPEGVKSYLEALEDPTRKRKASANAAAGSGLPRASVSVEVSGGNFEDTQHFGSFSEVANKLNWEVEDLQKAYAVAAGVEHRDIKTVTVPVNFDFDVHYADKVTTYSLKISPKPRAPKGSKAASSDATETETDNAAE